MSDTETPTVNDVSMTALQSALHGLTARQRTQADNVANLQTPGFLAGKVDFEDTLREAIEDGEAPTDAPEMSRSMAPTRTDGNNVNLDDETLGQIDTNLRYQLSVEALNAKFRLLRSAIGGS